MLQPAIRVDVDAVGWCEASTGSFELTALTRGGPFPGPSREGLSTQVARCRVDDALVLVVHALGRSPLNAEDRARLAVALSSNDCVAVVFVCAVRTGACQIEIAGQAPSTDAQLRAAVAAAVVQASWAWDESNPIVVTAPQGTHRIALRFGADGWMAESQ